MNTLSPKIKSAVGVIMALTLLTGSLLAALPVAATGTTVFINPPTQVVANGATFTVDIAINTSVASRGWQAQVTFDASKLICNSITEGGFLKNYALANGGMTIPVTSPVINNTTGHISDISYAIVGAGSGGPSGSGTLVTLNFTAKDPVNDWASIAPTAVVVSDVLGNAIPGVVVNGGQVGIGSLPVPNLQVTALSFTPGTPNTNYTINFTISNVGTGPAVASVASVVIDGGSPTYVPVSALAVGASENKTLGPITVSGPADVVVVTADATNLVSESNEGDNTRTGTYSPVGDQGTTVITSNIKGKIVMTAPANIENWLLEQGPNTIAGNLNIKSNVNWSCATSDQNTSTSGRMRAWNGATYGTQQLIEALKVRNQSQSKIVTLPTAGEIANGTPAGQNGDLGQDFGINFDQTVKYADPVLTDPAWQYRIVVSFQASQTV